MIEMPNMLMISGNARNIGKTTLACAVIQQVCSSHEIWGLKVTSIRPGEDKYHGSHASMLQKGFVIVEETDADIPKDTARMLKAGAGRSFYMQTADTDIADAAGYLKTYLPHNVAVVCESRSLRKVIKPGIFVFLQTESNNLHLKTDTEIIALANVVHNCNPGMQSILDMAQGLRFHDNRWIINN